MRQRYHYAVYYDSDSGKQVLHIFMSKKERDRWLELDDPSHLKITQKQSINYRRTCGLKRTVFHRQERKD